MRLAVLALSVLLVSSQPSWAQEHVPPLADVLELEATVTSDVVPDLAVVTLSVVREGAEVPALTRQVNEALARAFAEAKAVPSVIAANAGYSTTPRYDGQGSTTTRAGWSVRGSILLKSKDFDALGTLVGKLSQTLQITGSGFEISPELRARETASLLDRGARAFQDKAVAASRAFGYSGYAIRQVSVGSAGESGGRLLRAPMMEMSAMSKSAVPLPVEAGQVTLSLSVSGSVQMRK